MNWLDFFSSIIGSLAWPVAFVIAASIFRRPLRDLMKRMTDVEVFGNKATFKSELEKAEQKADQIPRLNAPDAPEQSAPTPAPTDDYLKLASEYPSAAIIEAFKKVEAVIDAWQDAQGMTHPPSNSEFVRWLVDDGSLSKEAYGLYKSVTTTRNIAVHTSSPISTGEAIAYKDLCNRLVFYLRDAIAKFEKNRGQRLAPKE